MTIATPQLEVWSHQGATVSSATAYDAVKRAIAKSTDLSGHSIDVYLQGSYRNSTNIRGESDVDIVVHCDNTFYYDLDRLDPTSRDLVKREIAPATYEWDEFRGDVHRALVDSFGGSAVTNGNKCFTVAGAGGTGITADVVPCFNHRLYVVVNGQPTYIEGMAFKTARDGRIVRNYPKQHYKNGSAKNQSTNEWFKPSVRVFKNVKARLVDTGYISEDLAPSYFIECLLYNVPDTTFAQPDWVSRFVALYNCLDGADMSRFTCVNGVLPLFDASPEQWSIANANAYLAAVKQLWNG